MPTLKNYTQFDGLHWETGTVRNALDYQGVKAPHTNKPYSEAMLMGISGGAVMGNFSFVYEGHDPHARILTRNTFDPWDTLLSRLGIVQNVMHTSKADKAVKNLVETLEEGVPAIVWADMFSLPYNDLSWGDDMWAMMPIVVYGYDEAENVALISDRSFKPLHVETAVLQNARARVKKDKHRIITLDPPNPEKLATAVQAGIWDSIKLYTEKPPKGSKNNFGLAAYQHWITLLTKPKTRQSWEKLFPTGRPMLAALISQYSDIMIFGKNSPAERDVYADFLNEAATLLDKPALNGVADCFRKSGEAWGALAQAILSDGVPMFAQSRALLDKQHQLFLHEGNDSITQRREILQQINGIKETAETDFPLDAAQIVSYRENIAEHVAQVHEIEAEAVQSLKEAML